MTNAERCKRINARIKRITMVLNMSGPDAPIVDFGGSCIVVPDLCITGEPTRDSYRVQGTADRRWHSLRTGKNRIGKRQSDKYNPEGDMR